MSKCTFQYDPIDIGTPTFRLLCLLKGDGRDICCRLFHCWLHQAEGVVSYEALSYTWGSTEVTDSIEVNNRKLAVTPNLYLALSYLRLRDRDRVLWVDAICIDRRNVLERGHQVRRMGDIYKQADGVIFWLGQATYETNVLMDSLQQLQVESATHVSKDWKHGDDRWVDLWTAIQCKLKDKHSSLLDRQRKGLQSMLHRPWFRRVWILQEVANAKAAIVCCGRKSVAAHLFALAPILMGVTPDRHCRAVLDIMPGPARRHSWWRESHDLYTLLEYFGKSEAYDSRDLIYALLGISSDARDSDMLRPDYGKSVEALVQDAADFLYFGALLNPLPRTIQSFLRQLRHLNGIALGKLIGRSDMKTLETLLERGVGEITEAVVRFTAEKCSSREELTRLIIQHRAHDIKITEEVATELARLFFFAPMGSVENRHVTEGTVAAVLQLLNWRAQLDTKDEKGRTLFSYAVEFGQEAVVELLLNRGADINMEDNSGRTLISYAVESGQEALVELLLNRRADINVEDKSGRTVINYAIESGQGALVELLLNRGADIDVEDKSGRTLISYAVESGQGAVMELLLNRGADVEMDKSGRRLVDYAINFGQRTVAKLGLDRFLSSQSNGDERHLSLIQAVDIGRVVPVKLLLDYGAEIEARDSDKRTALTHAVFRGHEAVIRLLLDRGANIETRDREGRTPLSYAAETGDAEVVKLLHKAGANANSKSSSGRTPLSYAAQSGHADVVWLQLLKNGIRVNSKSGLGQTPLSYAAEFGHADVVNILLHQRSVKADSKSSSGRTPLSYAAEGGHDAAVKMLVDRGANIVSKDKEGRTPATWAAGKGHYATAALLSQASRQSHSEEQTRKRPDGYPVRDVVGMK